MILGLLVFIITLIVGSITVCIPLWFDLDSPSHVLAGIAITVEAIVGGTLAGHLFKGGSLSNWLF